MKNMIIVENRLREVLNYLPEMRGDNNQLYKPVFKAGDEKELLAFFAQTKEADVYPLIWLDMPFEENHTGSTRVEVDLNLILAVKTDISLLHTQRLALTYEPILLPLADNILKSFWIANTISFDNKFKATKFPNYSEEDSDKAVTTDLWDALKLNIRCEINNKCLREIKI